MNHSFANSQNILKTTLEDFKDILEHLQSAFEEVMKGANPDRMEEFVKKSLKVYHEHFTHAKRNHAMNKEQFNSFKNAYGYFSNKIQDAKRDLKKREEFNKKKRSLSALHKLSLPNHKDSLDGGPWVEQVDHMLEALDVQEQYDPLIKQQVLTIVKNSLKASTRPLKILMKTLENWNELDCVVEKIKDHLENQYNVIEDFGMRVKAMKPPKSKLIILNNCNDLVLNIEYLINKDMVKNVDPHTFHLLLDKALHPTDHKAKFEIHMSLIFLRDDERGVSKPECLTELQRMAYKMQQYNTLKKGKSTQNKTELSYQKVTI